MQPQGLLEVSSHPPYIQFVCWPGRVTSSNEHRASAPKGAIYKVNRFPFAKGSWLSVQVSSRSNGTRKLGLYGLLTGQTKAFGGLLAVGKDPMYVGWIW